MPAATVYLIRLPIAVPANGPGALMVMPSGFYHRMQVLFTLQVQPDARQMMFTHSVELLIMKQTVKPSMYSQDIVARLRKKMH